MPTIPSEPASRRDVLRGLSMTGAGAVLATGSLPAPARAHSPDLTVLRRASLIDGTGAPVRRGVTIVITGGRIAWIGDDHGAPGHRAAKVVDLRGRYVIPGLWDMHTHGTLDEKIAPPLYIANGVLGVREMWGSPPLHALRDRIERGDLLGPRMVVASNIIDGPVSLLGPLPAKVANAAEARRVVRAEQAAGADFAKIYSYLGRDAFHALTDEARAAGLPVAGHVPYLVPMAEASRAGQRCFEHLLGLTLATSGQEPEFRRRMEDTPIDPADPRAWYTMVREMERLAADTYDPAKARDLYKLLIRDGSRHSPTLSVLNVVTQPAETYADDPRLKYMPAAVREVWAESLKIVAPVTPEQIAQQRHFFNRLLGLVGRLHRAGVGLLGGTDCYNPYVFPGFSAHDELSLLVRAGLAPMAALQTMTRDAARFLGQEHTSGTLAPGKAADLVVLNADPLADIRNTRRIHAVMTRGRLIGPRERAHILAEVEAAAKEQGSAAAVPTCACH
ncbi:amidohydrolase family protein [Nonomuraea endophytica]|uniref:Imidazolonepropionase-like amidohydrolase n=1 Tax=Nonomuraea endophytica TaxID=714136 RepID=A0A7W8A3W9_9ACTN|nr:amidohydrolase family protein [Nonomuraea endophytica]MBB5079082.1 imidazolonepropionase-like amidohydrolase [Nonomuraea endophytica]